MKHILLCCGAGMSSGFLAQNMRKSAKKQKVQVRVDAVAESDVDSYLSNSNILLVGPHLTYMFERLQNKADQLNIPMIIIPEDIYGSLDGERLLKLSLENMK